MRRIVAINVSIGLLYLADRWWKLWFYHHPAFTQDFIIGFLSFHFVSNPGIAFGLAVWHWLLWGLIIGVVVVLATLLLRAYQQSDGWTITATSLLLAGALSNTLDRLRFGFVIDYIAVPFFTVFNLADCMITLGAVLLAWQLVGRRPAVASSAPR